MWQNVDQLPLISVSCELSWIFIPARYIWQRWWRIELKVGSFSLSLPSSYFLCFFWARMLSGATALSLLPPPPPAPRNLVLWNVSWEILGKYEKLEVWALGGTSSFRPLVAQPVRRWLPCSVNGVLACGKCITVLGVPWAWRRTQRGIF